MEKHIGESILDSVVYKKTYSVVISYMIIIHSRECLWVGQYFEANSDIQAFLQE